MQKLKFGIMCPGLLFVASAQAYPSMKNSALMFRALDAPERAM
jgi:hypothetical protein